MHYQSNHSKKIIQKFDWKFYINEYPDLFKSEINTEKKAIRHWEKFGKKENRYHNISEKIINNKTKIFYLKNNLIYILFNSNYHKKFVFKKKSRYLLSPIDVDFNWEKILILNKCPIDGEIINMFFVNGMNDKYFVLLCQFDNDQFLTVDDLLKEKKIIQHQLIIGKKKSNFNSEKIALMQYFFLGKNKIDISNFGLFHNRDIYKDFVFEKNIETKTCSFEIFKRYFYYFKATICQTFSQVQLNWNIFSKKKKYFHNNKCLIISKSLEGYGGNQKSGFQLIELLERKYNILIWAYSFSNIEEYNLKTDLTLHKIHNSQILKFKKKDDLIEEINNGNYQLIINNKHNNFMHLLPKIKKKCPFYVVTHNSMDPFNRLIINNQHFIDKIFTINRFHQKLLLKKYTNKPVVQYCNYVTDQEKCNKRYYFQYRLLYVGRLSKEKNVHLLIESFKKVLMFIPNLQLLIAGSGKQFKKVEHPNIIFLGKMNFLQIKKNLKKCDYLVLPSSTEGIPYCILEAMSLGIPCIYSNINGSDEIITHNYNGFLFELKGFEKHKDTIDNWNVLKEVEKHFLENIINLSNCIVNAYSISIEKWNKMSENCYVMIQKNYLKTVAQEKNDLHFSNIQLKKKKEKKQIFINFLPENISYGGGNTWCHAFVKNIKGDKIYSNAFNITYQLSNNIDIFMIIDPFKDKKYKKYSLVDIVEFRNRYHVSGKIIIRVNDCDKTRPNSVISREKEIKKYQKDIDYFIFNSKFIKEYYQKIISFNQKNSSIIYNGCNQDIFFPDINKPTKMDKIKLVTHHWSSNLYKGYQTYLKLWNLSQIDNLIEFTFIGKNIPDMFQKVPIIGPFHGKKLANELKKNHIYVTDSKYDSCPNHVIEAISCGLPILFTSCDGGGKNLCNLPSKKIGEPFTDFLDLLYKIKIISSDYNVYRKNVLESTKLYSIKQNIDAYLKIFNDL